MTILFQQVLLFVDWRLQIAGSWLNCSIFNEEICDRFFTEVHSVLCIQILDIDIQALQPLVEHAVSVVTLLEYLRVH